MGFICDFYAWVLRKLGEVAQFSKGKGYKKEDLLEKGIPIILYGSLYTDYKTIISDITTFAKLKDNSVISTGNEVIVPASGETPKEISRASVVSKKGIILGGDLNIIKGTTINPIFLAITISNGRQKIEMAKRAQGKSVVHLHNSDLEQINLFFPSIMEQQAIGSLFKKLDDLIALQQRKIDILKLLKKALLQQIIPENNHITPRIRLTSFKEHWNQDKINNIFKVTRGQVLSTALVSETKTDIMKYPVYSSQTKNDGLLGYFDKFLFEDAITWTTDGANAGTVNFRKGKFYSTNVNGVLISKGRYANQLVAEIINRIAWKYVSRVGNPKLMNNTMSDIKISVPQNYNEQNIMSLLVQNLDDFLDLTHEKNTQLKIVKKSLLQKMFI